jgi:hypothetical protein
MIEVRLVRLVKVVGSIDSSGTENGVCEVCLLLRSLQLVFGLLGIFCM